MNTFDYKRNSFDYIRLFASLQVLIGHYYLFYKESANGNPILIMNWFSGVIILFTISGFLACASIEHSQNALQYIKKRFVRILPPYYTCIIINALVILIIYPILPTIKDIIVWLITTIFAFHITPDFLSNYATGSSNGSLWSIFVILQFYILTALFYPIIKKWNQIKHLALILLFVCANIGCGYLCRNVLSDTFSELLRRTFVPYLYIFLIGMYLYTFRDKIIPVLAKYWYLILGIYLLGSTFSIQGHLHTWCYTDPFTGIFVPIITIALACGFGAHRIKYDFSYGIFLYHFAVMNVLIYLGVPATSFWSLILMITISLILSAISLFAIEKPLGKLLKTKFNL